MAQPSGEGSDLSLGAGRARRHGMGASATVLDKYERLAGLGARAPLDDVLDLLVDLLVERGWRMQTPMREACGELAVSILGRAGHEARRSAALRLATLDPVPGNLLMALAREPVEIAEPVLRHGRTLTSAQLLRIASEASVEHLRAVAGREALSEAMTTLMLLRGDRDTLLRCLRNPHARLSRAAFGSLAEMALTDRGIRVALAHRADLPDTVVDHLWPHLTAPQRARLVTGGFPYDAEQLAEIRREAAVRGTVADLDAAILDMTDPGGVAQAAILLAAAAGLDAGLSLNLACGTYERGLVLLARGAGLGEGGFLRLVCNRASFSGHPTNIRRCLRLFEETDRSEARAVLAELARAGEAKGGAG